MEFSRFQNKHSVGTYSRASTTDPAKDYYAVLRNTKAPARVITEYAYLDSLDYTIIDTLAEQVREAYLIAIAVCKFYGKTFKDII
jgi:hypothetical protein